MLVILSATACIAFFNALCCDLELRSILKRLLDSISIILRKVFKSSFLCERDILIILLRALSEHSFEQLVLSYFFLLNPDPAPLMLHT